MNLAKAAQHYGSIIELSLQRMKYSLRGRFRTANEQILANYIELLPRISRGQSVYRGGQRCTMVKQLRTRVSRLENSGRKLVKPNALLARAYRKFPTRRRFMPSGIRITFCSVR